MRNATGTSFTARLFAPVDISFLVFFRIAFGAIMLWEVWRDFAHDRIGRYYVSPPFHFKYYGFEWVQAWGGQGMYLHFYGLGILAVCILAGFFYRLATALFFCGFTYVYLLDQTRYLNHFYLVCLIAFLLILLPAHRAFSLDALINPKLRSPVAPAWTLWILRAQIGIVYFYGGIAKLNPDWLRGEPMRMWLAARNHFPVLGAHFEKEWVVYGFTYGGLLLDLLIVPLLLWRRTRWFGFLWGASFHLLNFWLFNIGIFPWFMLCATLIFFPPDFPKRLWRFLTGRGMPPDHAAPATPAAGPWEKAVVRLLALYLVAQIFIPLRHLAYPGNVHWTEEGHRFSWRMKLRTKRGTARFEIVQPATGRAWDFHPEKILDSKQLRNMATHPDMILQFAHYAAEEMQRNGHGEVEVYAHVEASLNGRKPQLLVDPTVNLAREPRTLMPAHWILPLSEPLRTRDGNPEETLRDDARTATR